MRLEQILVNLMDNAVKFNRPGGFVRVCGEIVDGRPVVRVEDSGVGIPADSAEKVFHRFYRVDKARSKDLGGTGLGLSIVKHLMRLHGGQVRVESELGRGSTFILEFPPADAAA
jgi:two-component system phosphate regulon sensor histidine kinase PhoR